jgi:uncharacterized membrane protein
MFPKARLDTLSDGIFGVAMTLLILGDHLRHRRLSAILLIVSSLLAIALSFVNSEVALWAFALNFAGPLIRKWSRRAEAFD